MTVYGKFQALRQIHLTHHGAIWSARNSGTHDSPDCCIKVIDVPPASTHGGDKSAAENLLVAATLQQAMGNKSEYWAPVYAFDSHGNNAFYVTRLFPRSAQTLIENKLKLTSAELKIILLEVLEGLMDLEAAFHRSHGNLKPANILIGDKSRIRKGAVYLTDPDASNEDRPSLTRTPDSKAIGELIYALVTHKPHVTARWPLTKTPHWKRLGSTGKQWFALSDDLLNTVSRRGLPTLERVKERVESINPTHRALPRSVIALILLVGLGAGGYVERDKLPGWYQIGKDQSLTWIASGKEMWASLFAAPKPTTQPTAKVDTAKPTARTVVLANPPVAPVNPNNPTQPPTLPPRAPDEGMRIVQGTLPPELHSEVAKKEFVARQKKFALSYAGFGSSTVLSDWTRVLARVQRLDQTYPPLDLTSTAGWPQGLTSVLNGRRDEALVRLVDAAFDNARVDADPFQSTETRVIKAADAAVTAREAMARGDVVSAQKSIQDYHDALAAFPASEADLKQMFSPVDQEFTAMTNIQSGTDRSSLTAIADDESAALATRVAAWFRLGAVDKVPWPGDFATLGQDDLRAARLATLLQETGSVSAISQLHATAAARRDAFFGRLKDQNAVAMALRDSNNDKFAPLLAKAPIWFQYDAALYVLKTIPAGKVTDAQKQRYTELSSKVDAPSVQLVHDVMQDAQSTLPISLAQSGPASIKGWQLRPGWTRDHCTYISPAGTDTLEFIRVHVPDDPNGVDCYLCTTEAPIALLRHLVNGNLTAFNITETLNNPTVAPAPGMRTWKFNDGTGSVDLDDSDYRKCFIVSPNDQLPLNFVTPQTAFYLSRRLGCRLPTTKEWLAALGMARNSTDVNMKGFATMGLRLRDRQFARLLANPNREKNYWPDDNIFIGDTGREVVPRQANAAIWRATDLERLTGRPADSTGATLWPLSTLAASSGFGFRTVGDTDNYAGVFHDLIGNVAEYTMDSPVMLAEKVVVAPSQAGGETVRRVNDWFNPDHFKTVNVIGGSALSPPNMNPDKPCPLSDANGQSEFADVGFRLAFTDPSSIGSAQRAVIGEASYLTAP